MTQKHVCYLSALTQDHVQNSLKILKSIEYMIRFQEEFNTVKLKHAQGMANFKFHGMLQEILKLPPNLDALGLSEIVNSRFPAYHDNGRSIGNELIMLSAIRKKKKKEHAL